VWDAGTTWYWKVRAVNQETGDHDEGPVWRFRTAPADAPVDSLTILPLDTSTWDNSRRVWRCDVLSSGPAAGGIVRYQFPAADSDLVVAGVYVAFLTITLNPNPNASPQLWQSAKPLAYCTNNTAGFPATPPDGYLAAGTRDEFNRFVFSSGRLTSQIVGRLRHHPEFSDYVVISQTTLSYNPSAFHSGLVITYYKPPGTTARAAAGVR